MIDDVIEPFKLPALERISKIVGDYFTGFEITGLFKKSGYPEMVHDGSTKWRFLCSTFENLQKRKFGPEEIRRKVDNYTKGKEIALTENERQMLEQIKKPLEKYEKTLASILSRKKPRAKDQMTFDPRQGSLMLQKRDLNVAWKKCRKIIRKEEMLGGKGTILELAELENKRESIVGRLIELEKITEDNNEELVINQQKFLDPETREIISKNEIDELSKLDNTNKKFNRFAFIVTGVIVAGGLSYIIGVILI